MAYEVLPVLCERIEIPRPPPQLNIPHFGIMQKAWNALGKIPSPSELLAQFQDQLALALAPVRRFLEMVETFITFKNCLEAIPKAVKRMNPTPIYDCLKELRKAIARLLSWVPPFSYIRLAADIASYCMDLIDEVVEFFVAVDTLLTEYIQVFTDAELLGDLDLMDITLCGATAFRAHLSTVLDLLKFIQPINNVLLEVFVRLFGSAMSNQMKKVKDDMDVNNAYLASVSTAVSAPGAIVLPPYPGHTPPSKTQHVLVPVPPLSPLIECLNQTRNAMVYLYNALAVLTGDDEKLTRQLPEFQNF